MNKYKVSYWLSTILDYGLTFGGTAGIIIYNYVSPQNSNSFKISLTGIVLIVALLLTCKTIFEHRYQDTHNALLQQLSNATDQAVKEEINKKINAHKITQSIYQRLMVLMPFVILLIVAQLGSVALGELAGTAGFILMSMGAGSIFNVIKKPLKEKADLIKFERKAGK